MRLLTRLYQRLGASYPTAFIAVELQSAYLITVGTIVLLAQYYDASSEELWRLVATVLAINVITLNAGLVLAHRRLAPVRAWIAGARGEAEALRAWQVAAAFPMTMLRRDMPLPIVTLLIPATIATIVQFDLGWTSAVAIIAAGCVAVGYAAILHYYAIEIGLRPVLLDINESLPPRFTVPRASLPLAAKLLGTLPLINIITGLTVSAITSDGGGAGALGFSVLVATTVAFTISFELTILVTKSILRPVNDIKRATRAVHDGDYAVKVPITSGDELGELGAAFNEMAAGLAERERLREAFGTYLDRDVARLILEAPGIARGVQLDVSVLFCDVKGFTRFASERPPTEVVAALNAMFEVLVPIVERHGGHVDKFLGDGLMAVFGAPENYPDHADRAVAAGVAMAQACAAGYFGELEIGVGVNTGRVLAGSVGGAGRLNFSVMGDAVNVAARVEAATRITGHPVLITAATAADLHRTWELEPLGLVGLRGRDEPVELFAPATSLPQAAPAASARVAQ